MFDISIIVPTTLGDSFNKSIKSILNSIDGENIEVIVVVDNKNIDINNFLNPNYKIYYSPKNGVASARNYGASISNSSYLLFIDDDILITKNAITEIKNFVKTNPQDCLNIEWDYPPELYDRLKKNVFGRYLIHYGFTSMRGWSPDWKWENNTVYKIPMVASYFLLVSKSSFLEIGGYNEQFPYAGFEDFDFATRINELGIGSFLSTRILIYHNEEAKTAIKNWMNRKITGSYTRKIGVTLGYSELEIRYSKLKFHIYNACSNYHPSFLKLSNYLPNISFFDPVNFKLINFIHGLSIFIGYNKRG